MGWTIPVLELLTPLILTIIFWTTKCSSESNVLVPVEVDLRYDKITLSGVSSGATMAMQLQFSYSSLFSGIAVFSHAYYRCGSGKGDIDDYDRLCTLLFNSTMQTRYNPDLVHKDIQNYLNQGLIEDPKNLRNTKLYVYAGLRNWLFSPDISLNILRVYEPYIGSLDKIFTRVQDANLVLPTDSTTFGGPCTEWSKEMMLIGQCGFSGMHEALHFLLDGSHMYHTSDIETVEHYYPRQRLLTFDQREFTRGLENHFMDDTGFYYVPYQCSATGSFGYGTACYLHFYFHGCLTGREYAGTTHVENTGILELADRLGIIVVFPQAKAPEDTMSGCWDSFGLSGPLYATQKGAQVTAVKRMLDRMLAGHK